jgi:hypothetical protein
MKTIEIKLYKFNELSEEAKQTAIEKNIDINLLEDWYDSICEDAKNIGLKITSFDLDRNRNAKGDFLLSACEVAQNILNEHVESCETYKTAQSFMEDWQPVFNDYMNEESENYESRELEDEMQDLEDDFLKSLCEDYSIMLQNEYEYLYSDEAIIETIEANDYDFTEDGSRY